MKKELTQSQKKDLEALMSLSQKERDTLTAFAAGRLCAPQAKKPEKQGQ